MTNAKVSQLPTYTPVLTDAVYTIADPGSIPASKQSSYNAVLSLLEPAMTRFPVLAPGSSPANLIHPSADIIPLTLRRYNAGAVSDLFQLQDETGTVLTRVAKGGDLQVGAIGGGVRQIALGGDHPTVPWKIDSRSSVFTGIRDDVLNIGMNYWYHTDLAKAGNYIQLENDFFFGGVHQSEYIMGWISPDGLTARRPMQANVRYDNNKILWLLDGEIHISDSTGSTDNFVFADGGGLGVNGSGYLVAANNVQWIKQVNSGGTEVTLFYLTGADFNYLSPTAITTLTGGRLGVGFASPSTPNGFFNIHGTHIPTGSSDSPALLIDLSINPVTNHNVFALENNPTVHIPAGVVTGFVAGIFLPGTNIVLGAGASVSQAATVWILDAPSNALDAYALLISSGKVAFGGGLGIWGHAVPASQPVGGVASAGGSWTATEQQMLQKAYDCLRGMGALS